MIDSHIHSDSRPYEDFEIMAAIFDCVITHAHDPLKMRSFDVLLDHFDRILEVEIEKAKKNGLKMYACIGIHPRAIPKNIDYDVLKSYFKKEGVIGVGEIGLEKCTKNEIEIFLNQVSIAKEMNLPVVIHTPRTNKEYVTREILENLETLSLSLEFKKKIVIEHVTKETIPILWDTDYNLGLTVQPQKLSSKDVFEIVSNYCEKRFLLNSDSSSAPSDIFSVPKTASKLKAKGISNSIIKAISHENTVRMFNLKI
ncbi:TatD-related deoxyribonuclease [Methanococcus vannielii SB]|uniref:TatD-related deoxyribonuclease n=1 Tax=Methanococcus vannielii (strain ATCC 35089 / DSM 1224 / JCM 13029 / OCM 148 / SB) TaxID=406327 RepID=A6US41_METVS|nr:TatD family hydrolase [Methanococcus vannielii]ABR55313.1 TatD-related deoxyribonuclease [Methanococcus vannielii SB]